MLGSRKNLPQSSNSLSCLCSAFKEGDLNVSLGDRLRSLFFGRLACWLDRALGDRSA